MEDLDLLFLRTGKQYIDSAIYLMKAICRSGNQTGAIADSLEEAEKIMKRKVALSDLTLFLPALFDYYHGLELYIKGIIYMYNKTHTTTHETTALVAELKNTQTNKELILLFEEVYAIKEGIISKFKKENNISNQIAIYESLRYPVDNKFQQIYDYTSLRYNGIDGIKEIRKIIKKLNLISSNVIEEYRNNEKSR